MSIWKVKPIDVEPELYIDSWIVFEVTSKLWRGESRHFVGYNVYGREGRVSSPIVEFDKKSRIGKTRSGRTYKLVGDDGSGSSDGRYTWDSWCKLNQVETIKNVSKDYV